MPEYIFCYDISDVKRLRKAAKILQGQALRIQKSVYLLVGTPTTMHRCWQQLSDCVDAKKMICGVTPFLLIVQCKVWEPMCCKKVLCGVV
jgi:CRISPR-associated endonuclease Cas2